MFLTLLAPCWKISLFTVTYAQQNQNKETDKGKEPWQIQLPKTEPRVQSQQGQNTTKLATAHLQGSVWGQVNTDIKPQSASLWQRIFLFKVIQYRSGLNQNSHPFKTSSSVMFLSQENRPEASYGYLLSMSPLTPVLPRGTVRSSTLLKRFLSSPLPCLHP